MAGLHAARTHPQSPVSPHDQTYARTVHKNSISKVKTNGSDIYYQGESKKELPIKCKITYTLDGKEISAEDLAGKSGKVKITIEYENEDAHEVYINGRKQTLYTPFTVACGTIFKNTENKNIEITNGKIVNDGTKTMVLGIALPGMQESLNISNKTVNLPNKVEISMETSKFEQNNIITFVTPKIFDESISFDKLNELYSKVNEIIIIRLLHKNIFFFMLKFLHLLFKNISYTLDSFYIILLYFLSNIFHVSINNSSITKIFITPYFFN